MNKFMLKTTVLAVVLILTTTALTFAQYAPEGDFVVVPSGNGVEIQGYNGRGGAVNIPPTIGGRPVISIYEAFKNNTTITSITIPNSVIEIMAGFENMTRLTSVTINSTDLQASTGAFRNCTALTSVTIGTGITEIANFMFQGCTALRNITIPVSVTRISPNAFSGCTSLATITILRESTGANFTGTVLGNINAFNNTAANLSIRVPANSVNAYKTATNWSTHASKISGN